ncbi:hypothetical protein JQ621_02325 [Bradyrhizobium manausense]|uniref:hypothetical protein n=1 Tax=Bradyrhizobium manausense TaxID=989370 RepID=UPI001BABDD09|nr:hypothetical protein [Bradyrhizobium manausense]MBR1086307.1 hypothetical protein [Bradyrhizobium manausense]
MRFAIALLFGALLMVGTAGSAQAKHGHRHRHAHHHAPTATARLAAQEPSSLGPMRYYGGPKSPMWRGPAAN